MKKTDDIATSLKAWAKKNKAGIEEQEGSVIVSKGGWSVEVRPEDGWAYVHGRGSLDGTSTNIEEIGEFDAAIKRLTGAK